MINTTVFTGRVTKALEVRQTSNGKSVGSVNLAVNRNFKNQDGNYDADFPMLQFWGKMADNFAKYTSKGSLVGIEGRLQTRNYEDKNGNRVYVTEIVVNNFTLLDSKNNNNQSNNSNPFENPSAPTNNTGEPEISDDDLPF
ncbi:single-stranded DNA-binding protein [Fructilactobacillus fructivorans]|uniref:Single-stranded DNA-binding protein n=1 Tax=Fructilactobacillus fructivorans TaxID=1614 RepID=A0AAE6NZT2_9LACO|nr:single-stranded DNA-binding protein [Fructilactobacillus fructivorans]KRK58487.1 single-strand binding protein [Fructilactobacillus fructivorans]QFX92496.1 single-stranded DNA-binding protein [Fructilactobacillus fructivorans]RDV65908.1 single-stranded DNA-binding protein [Fructilactobacillus fructivorans]